MYIAVCFKKADILIEMVAMDLNGNILPLCPFKPAEFNIIMVFANALLKNNSFTYRCYRFFS